MTAGARHQNSLRRQGDQSPQRQRNRNALYLQQTVNCAHYARQRAGITGSRQIHSPGRQTPDKWPELWHNARLTNKVLWEHGAGAWPPTRARSLRQVRPWAGAAQWAALSTAGPAGAPSPAKTPLAKHPALGHAQSHRPRATRRRQEQEQQRGGPVRCSVSVEGEVVRTWGGER